MVNILMVLGAIALLMVIGVLFNLCRLLRLVVCDMEASKRKAEQVCEVEEEEIEYDFLDDDEYSDVDEEKTAADDLLERLDWDSDELPFPETPSVDLYNPQPVNNSNSLPRRREEI